MAISLPTKPRNPDNGSPTGHLPSPEAVPGADVVIFDGKCKLCIGSVRRLHRLDGGRLAYLSLHDIDYSRMDGWPSREDLLRRMHVLTPTTETYSGADAVRYLSRKIPWLYVFAPMLHFPFTMPMWRFLYRTIARFRYRFGRVDGEACSSNTCKAHVQR